MGQQLPLGGVDLQKIGVPLIKRTHALGEVDRQGEIQIGQASGWQMPDPAQLPRVGAALTRAYLPTMTLGDLVRAGGELRRKEG